MADSSTGDRSTRENKLMGELTCDPEPGGELPPSTQDQKATSSQIATTDKTKATGRREPDDTVDASAAGETGSTDKQRSGRVSVLHMMFFFAFGGSIPFFTVYLRHVLIFPDGTPATYLIGLTIFLLNGVGVLATPIAGYISDRFRLESGILAICALVVSLGTVALAVPGFHGALPLGTTILIVIPAALVFGFFERPMVPLINTETLNYLHWRYADSSGYGRFRRLGSAAFVVSTTLAGLLMATTGQVAMPLAMSAVGFFILAILASRGVPAKLQRVRIPWEHLKGDRLFQRFLVFAFLVSLGMNSAFVFTGFFLDEIQAGFLILGLVLAVSAVLEVPVMARSQRILSRLGAKRMILAGVASQVIKVVLFATLAGTELPWLLVPVSFLHGIGFGLIYTGIIAFVDSRAHRDMRATYQNLFHLAWGSAVAVGGPFASFIIGLWNSVVFMVICGALLALTGVYLMVFVRPPAQPASG